MHPVSVSFRTRGSCSLRNGWSTAGVADTTGVGHCISYPASQAVEAVEEEWGGIQGRALGVRSVMP